MLTAIDMMKENDTGLLKLEQLDEFRTYLEGFGCKVRNGNNNTQLLFVGTSSGWAPIQKGAAGTVKTPIALRAVISDFLQTPLTRSMNLAKRISRAKKIPLDAPDIAQAAAAPVSVQSQAIPFGADLPCDPERVADAPAADATYQGDTSALVELLASSRLASHTLCHIPAAPDAQTHNVTLDRENDAGTANFRVVHGHRSIDQDGNVFAPTDKALERARKWREFGELARKLGAVDVGASGAVVIMPPSLRELAATGQALMVEAGTTPAPAVDLEHLEDLRDDFAIHCPLWQLEDESLAAFANRRWEYADVMMKARTAMCADS